MKARWLAPRWLAPRWLGLALALASCDPGVSAQPGDPSSEPQSGTDPFASRAACESMSFAADPARGPRIASWNVRWFPDGSSHGPSDQVTDVAHLACVVAALDVDAIALQEIMLHERGRRALRELTDAIARHTGGRWRALTDECPRDGRQHVVWLVNEARVEASGPTVLHELNPVARGPAPRDACAGHLRPGLGVHLRFDDGPDLHAVTVHLDSGTEARDHDHRAQSVAALGDTLARLRPRDADALVIGDFNTMGQRRPRIDAAQERAALDAAIGATSLRRLRASVECTEFYRGRGSLLDLALLSTSLLEGAAVEVAGPCATHRCRVPRGTRPVSLTHLSDHCPVVVTLAR